VLQPWAPLALALAPLAVLKLLSPLALTSFPVATLELLLPLALVKLPVPMLKLLLPLALAPPPAVLTLLVPLALEKFPNAVLKLPLPAALGVAYFLSNPLFTHLFFIDADIGFSPEAAFRLLLCDRDVAGGVYPLKREDWPAAGVSQGTTRKVFEALYARYTVNTGKAGEDGRTRHR
jgi:hypothetical protein